MLTLHTTSLFRKERKLARKRGLQINLLDDVIQMLAEEQPLHAKCRDHALTGRYVGHRECHIQNDWLLIYKIDRGKLILTATRTRTHSDLF